MLFHLLKKDLKKRKGVNVILFLFITLATVFLASSVNNILIVSSAVPYYMEYANVPDVNLIINSEKEKDEITNWIDTLVEDGVVNRYDYNTFLMLTENAVQIQKGQQSVVFNSKGSSLFLSTQDVDYVKAYQMDGSPVTLKPGELALSNAIMKSNNLNLGDKINITIDNVTKEFEIKTVVKDAAFGNEMVGMIRFLISQEDFDQFKQTENKLGLFYLMSDDASDLCQRINNQSFQTVINTVDKSMYTMVYSFDMIMAGLLILIGICLILIALLVLRFTLVFSMEEQYQEIGILKAIGLKNFAIKKIYLMKYLFIVSIGAILGFFLSIPISHIMIESVSQNMIMEQSEANIAINALCAICIILLVLSFCYFCTRKLNKVSAITAMRGGANGERFSNRGISLAKRHRMPVVCYLGIQDILSHMKRYMVLIVTFCISFLLITIPLNTINTMKSDEMIRKFLLDPESSVFVRNIEKDEPFTNQKDLKQAVHRVQQELNQKGYDAKLSALSIFFFQFNGAKENSQQSIMTIQMIDQRERFEEYSEGSAPVLENEIAFSKAVLEENDWSIGDYVNMNINKETKSMIITGSYTDYMQLGKSARINPVIDCEQVYMFDYWSVMVYMDSSLSKAELQEELQLDFPAYEWKNGQEVINQNIGGIQNMLQEMLLPMTAMLCAVIMLITLLMEKLFIAREKGEIAMMKSMGFSYRDIVNWQLIRMSLVVISSMMISIPLSFLSNRFVLKPIFAIMGAEVSIQVDPLQTYVLYPGILLIGILLATSIAARGIRSINIREMNNIE